MSNVYTQMSIGMLLTFATAWAVGTAPHIYELLFGNILLKWIVILAPLGMVLGFAAALDRISSSTAQFVFYAFSAIMGMSLSTIFVTYTIVSIAQVFLITSIAFAGLSMYGYVTKKDLSPLGGFLLMGLIGIIAAMVVNIFIGSSALDFAVSVIGVGIFAALTAHDTQKIKNEFIDHVHVGDDEWIAKSGIMGALSLYLDFINMFLMLLNLFGDRE